MTLERAVLFEHLRRILVPLHENAHQNNNNIGDDKGKELKLIKELLGVTSPFVLLIKPGSSHDKEHMLLVFGTKLLKMPKILSSDFKF